MTQNSHPYSDSIDRRTALTLLGGGLTALAGCNSASRSGVSVSPSSEDSSGKESTTKSWVPPEEQSEYITDSSFVTDGLRLSLELHLQNAADIVNFDLLDSQGNDFDSQYPDRGRVNLTLAEGHANEFTDEPPATEAITAGENTLVITFSEEAGKSEERIPLRLDTSVEFQQIALGGSVDDVQNDDALAIVLENTGPHATSTGIIEYANAPDNGSGKTLSSGFTILEPGETSAAVVPTTIWRPNHCSDYSERTLEFTTQSFWANSLTAKQSIDYSGNGFICGSLNGSPTVTSTEQISSKYS